MLPKFKDRVARTGMAILGIVCFMSLSRANSRASLSAALDETKISQYNRLYVHSILGYLTPEEFAQE